MAENKTKATKADVDAHLASVENEAVRADCQALAKLMVKWTKENPMMWGPSIVGFGSYHYKYESGREGDSCATGFAARKNEIAIYLVAEGAEQATLLGQLGRHKIGKSCLYIKRLSEIDTGVLEKLVKGSLVELGVSEFLCVRRVEELVGADFSTVFRPLPGRRRRPG